MLMVLVVIEPVRLAIHDVARRWYRKGQGRQRMRLATQRMKDIALVLTIGVAKANDAGFLVPAQHGGGIWQDCIEWLWTRR